MRAPELNADGIERDRNGKPVNAAKANGAPAHQPLPAARRVLHEHVVTGDVLAVFNRLLSLRKETVRFVGNANSSFERAIVP